MSKWCGIVTGRRRERVVGHMRAIIVGVAAAAALLATSCQPPPGSSTPGAGTWAVNPSATDASIAGDAVSTHLAYQPTVAAVGKLAVIFPGTSATTLAFSELTRALTGVGYHVIVLRYPNSLGTTAACPDSNAAADPDCFRVFRSEVVFGAGVNDPDGQTYDHPIASVNQSNSVVNRLTKLLDRLVAIKILFPEFATDPSFVARFRREAQAAANLNHPNIVGVYDWGKERGTYYIVMEYVDGQTVSEILRNEGPIEPKRAAGIAADVAAALGFAHRKGVVHRDVKPGNVLITKAGEVKVADFGIARAMTASSEENLTQTGSVMDYNPVNIMPDGETQGDFFSTTIGPYDMWAIEWLEPFIQIIGWSIIFVFAIPRIIAGIGLLNKAPWAMMMALIFGCLGVFSFPLGTALCGYTIWVYIEDNKAKRAAA